MAATTTAFNNLLSALSSAYPHIRFEAGDVFRWSPETKTVSYNAASRDGVSLLHETAHALLKHRGYQNDVELLRLERAAWTKAEELGLLYGVTIDEASVESALDTYRDWLHARSLCPSCQQNGIQLADMNYCCVVCNQQWTVNEARHTGLQRRRTAIKNTPAR